MIYAAGTLPDLKNKKNPAINREPGIIELYLGNST